jgi:hypothetical protein
MIIQLLMIFYFLLYLGDMAFRVVAAPPTAPERQQDKVADVPPLLMVAHGRVSPPPSPRRQQQGQKLCGRLSIKRLQTQAGPNTVAIAKENAKRLNNDNENRNPARLQAQPGPTTANGEAKVLQRNEKR